MVEETGVSIDTTHDLIGWGSDCCLTLTQQYPGENKLIFNEMTMMMSALY